MCSTGPGRTDPQATPSCHKGGDPLPILIVNAGSSSVKVRVVDGTDTVLASHDLPAQGGVFDVTALAALLPTLPPVRAVGHRIVHGGSTFAQAVRVDAGVKAQLCSLKDLAPLHQAAGLAALDATDKVLPETPAIACFDTAFHATLPQEAATYAVPREWRARYQVRRYGFHGLSHAYAARRALQLLDTPADTLRLISCHLGSGASLAAVRAGVCIDTTMGFTPLDGLIMATRCGSLDPGLVLWLQQHAGLTATEVGDALEHQSGLLALAGTADMQQALQAADAGDAAAALAIDVYLHRLRAEVAAMAAAMGGCDVLVFTGGVGEHAPTLRNRAATGLGFLGVGLDPARNAAAVGRDADISAADARVASLVLVAREDLEIAREVRAVLKSNPDMTSP